MAIYNTEEKTKYKHLYLKIAFWSYQKDKLSFLQHLGGLLVTLGILV